MGELEGKKGAWGYVEGGMGALSESIARSARDKGAEIYTDQVSRVMTRGDSVYLNRTEMMELKWTGSKFCYQ